MLGLLDDAVLVPLGVWVALRLTPRAVVDDARRRADEAPPTGRRWPGTVLVLPTWTGSAVLAWWLVR